MNQTWRDEYRQARLEELLADGVVRCHLSPRTCVIKPGQHGFCGVRANREGRLVTLNYGKSVHATEETIETEAVNHYAPGEPILSMDNIGCMMSCLYCHNWKTSQAAYVSDKDVFRYTPEDVVGIALRHGIRVISWTYNDPVVWHEFVRETAMLAKRAGLINLYKSAFFITPEAVEELLPYIDIFSISIKAIDPEYYRRVTKGRLEPVLDATKQVYRAGKHVEVSTLMITDMTDDEATARKVTSWVLSELDAAVPMHFVRFHPDYRMRKTTRTPVPRLVRAREIAREMGAEHVYLGNVYDTPFTDTSCNGCGALLVTRYGLNARTIELDGDGHCARCGRDAHFKLLPQRRASAAVGEVPLQHEHRSFEWHGDIRALHIQVKNPSAEPVKVFVRRTWPGGEHGPWRAIPLAPSESYRFIVAKNDERELGCEAALPPGVRGNLHEVFDRAHFPTVSVEESGLCSTDVTPLPAFRA